MSRWYLIIVIVLLTVNMWLTYTFYTSTSNTERLKSSSALSATFTATTDSTDQHTLHKVIDVRLEPTRGSRNLDINIHHAVLNEHAQLTEITKNVSNVPTHSLKPRTLKYPVNLPPYDRARRNRKPEKQVYDFIMKPAEGFCSENELPIIVIAVCSDVKNFERRQAIRETWASAFTKQKKSPSQRNAGKFEENELYKVSTEDNRIANGHVNRRTSSTSSSSTSSPFHQSVDGLDEQDSVRPKDVKRLQDTSISQTNLRKSVTLRSNTEDYQDTIESMDTLLSDRPKLEVALHRASVVANYSSSKSNYYYANVTTFSMLNFSESLVENSRHNLPGNKLESNHNQRSRAIYGTESTISDNQTFSVRVVFVLARPNEQHSNLQNYVKDELSQYGDVIQSDFVDSYANLTLKTLAAMRWTLEDCPEARFLLKTDDDVFVGVDNLLDLLNSSSSLDATYSDDVIIGHVMHGVEPVRDRTSHHYTPWSVYKGKEFPAYASGSGYIMSISAVRKLYEASVQRYTFFWLEDVYITGILAQQLSIPLAHDSRFHFRREMHGARGACWYSDVITEHQLDAEYLHWLWIALLELNNTKDSNSTKYKCNLFD